MKIDIYTFAVVLGITHSIQFALFLIEYHFHKNYKGPGWWLLWSSSAMVGFCFMLIRQIPSVELISILVQNVMFILAAMFLYVGIMRFLEKKERTVFLVCLFLIFSISFSYFVFFVENIHIRTILLWSTVFIMAALSSYDLILHKPKSGNTAVVIIIFVFLVHAIFSFAKVLLLLTGSHITELNSQTWLNTFSYMEVLIVTILWTYAMIMMINQRLTLDMIRAKDHFEIIFNTTPDAILITDLKEGKILSVNDKFEELTGYLPREVIGKSTVEMNFWFNPEERNRFLELVERQGNCFNYEAQFLHKDQRILTGLLSSNIIRFSDKFQLISMIRDITERKLKENEIIYQNNQLQILNSEKDKFFSIIAHDLKSPFSSFLALTEVMAEEIHKLPISEVIHLAAKMRDSAHNLYGLLDNLLAWSLLKQDVTKTTPANMTLYPEIVECVSTYTELFRKKNIEVKIQVSEDEMVIADPNMLRSLIRNLLSNAIKFTFEGGLITISAIKLPNQICKISVRDTGIGISKEMQSRLFKIDATTSRKGTNGELSCGLGLLLCSEFIFKLNGKIWVESEEGEGSCFHIELPSVGMKEVS